MPFVYFQVLMRGPPFESCVRALETEVTGPRTPDDESRSVVVFRFPAREAVRAARGEGSRRVRIFVGDHEKRAEVSRDRTCVVSETVRDDADGRRDVQAADPAEVADEGGRPRRREPLVQMRRSRTGAVTATS